MFMTSVLICQDRVLYNSVHIIIKRKRESEREREREREIERDREMVARRGMYTKGYS